ncbi:MAG: class I SAM-dependent methyltransferase [Elusimicrobiota bacterium]
MPRIRETVKQITKSLGVYSSIRDSKDWIYRNARDSSLAVRLGISRMTQGRLSGIREALAEIESDELFERVNESLRQAKKADPNFKAGASSPFNLNMLYILCRALKPDKIVETGVASGTSSFFILSALKKNGKGRLFSIDLPRSFWESSDYGKIDTVSLPSGRDPGWIVPGELRKNWELILGDAGMELPKLLKRESSIDVFFHDAEHSYEAMRREYELAWPCIRPGGALASDDVGWNAAFKEFSREKEGLGVSRRWFSFGLILKK